MANNVVTQEDRAVRDQRENRDQREQRRGWLQPNVNIVENKDGFVLEAEMPGVSKDGLEVLLEGNELTIIGRRGADESLHVVGFRSAPVPGR